MFTKILASVVAAVAVTAGGLTFYSAMNGGGCPFSGACCSNAASQMDCCSDQADCGMSPETCPLSGEGALKGKNSAVAAIGGAACASDLSSEAECPHCKK